MNLSGHICPADVSSTAMNDHAAAPPSPLPVSDIAATGAPPTVGLRSGRLANIIAPERSYDVDTLLVELGPGDDAALSPGICHNAEDLYENDSRFAIQEALEDFLDAQGLTATELLHRADAQQKLLAWPQHDNVIERIAAAQAQPGRWTAGMRAEELRGLEAQAMGLVRDNGHRGAPPGLNPRRLSLHVAQTAAAMSGFHARFAVDAALSAWLSTTSGFTDKLMLLLALDGDELSPEAAAVVDQIVGEIFVSRQGAADILAGLPGLDARLRTLGELWRGDIPGHETASSLLRRLAGFTVRLTGGRTLAGIERAVQRLLAGDQRFHPPANPFEARKVSAVIDELKAGAEALAALASLSRALGGERAAFLMDQRMSRLVSGENLENLLRGKSHQARIADLLALEAAATGEQTRAVLADAIIQHFEVRDFVQRIFEMTRAPAARLKVLSELHRGLSASGVPEPAKSRNLRMLDEVQYTFMRTNRVLTRIAVEGAATVPDVLEFMDLLAERVFIEGKSAGAVRGMLSRHLRTTPFVRAFVGQEMRPGESRAERFARFFDQAAAAGLEVRSPADARILLADDEPQALEYISMVLSDLGVRKLTQAPDGRAALSAFNAEPDGYDLIVCDWRMPHLSGLEVLKFVRASRPQQPFLMVTALSTLIAVEEAMAHDVTGYVAKPFTPEQLEAKVMVLLNRPPPQP